MRLKKLEKYINCTFMILTLLIPSFYFGEHVHGKTLRDLQNELNNSENEQTENNNKTQLTQAEIAKVKQEVTNTTNEIAAINKEMVAINDEITKLGIQIDEKDDEIKRIINYVEISSGENQYLEYLMGATSFKDFIYRAAVAEQLSNYNDSLITEYHNLITENNNKKQELTDKQKELQEKQTKLAADLASLKSEVTKLTEVSISLEDEIKMQKEVIQVYLDRGCSLDQEISTCGRETLPTGTAFYRPLSTGYISSEFSGRCYTNSSGKYICDYHEGTDFTNTDNSWQPVYSLGTGLVVSIWRQYPCGGNMVFVQHKMSDGSTYTVLYAHLRRINVSIGDIVTRESTIGIMGGNPNIETWDACSTGPHVHVQIAYGLYMTDYTSWSTFTAKSFDLRSVLNAPRIYSWFYDRISKY